MIYPIEVEDYRIALTLRDKLQGELRWLGVAAKSYPADVYRRLVGHSAGRLQWVMRNQLNLDRARVQFEIPADNAGKVRVRILWAAKGDCLGLAAAWSKVVTSMAVA